jgi:hypothetical protein
MAEPQRASAPEATTRGDTPDRTAGSTGDRRGPQQGARRAAGIGVGALLVGATAVLLGVGQGTEHAASSGIEPLGVDGADVSQPDRAGEVVVPGLGQDPAPSTTAPPPPPPPGPTAAPPGTWAELDVLLARYDVVLGALSGDPAAAANLAHPLTVQWHGVVAAGTELDESLRRRILDDLAERSMVVRPGPDGASFVTRALSTRSGSDGSIDFEHCGYSPGVGVHATTGAVLDELRASTRGHGRVERDADGRLVLVALVDEQLRVLGPGEVDPCPAMQAAARSGGA